MLIDPCNAWFKQKLTKSWESLWLMDSNTCIYIISKIPISIEIAQNEYKMKDWRKCNMTFILKKCNFYTCVTLDT